MKQLLCSLCGIPIDRSWWDYLGKPHCRRCAADQKREKED